MLKTLDKYLDDQAAGGGLPGYIRAWYNRERRFVRLLVISCIAHLVFYAVIVKLDTLSMKYRATRGEPQTVLVKVAELAAPPDRLANLRTASEPIERADLNRLEYDPERADDVNLTARSPRPAAERGNAGNLPSAQQIENQLRRTEARAARASALAALAARTAPPTSPTVQMNRPPQLDAPAVAQGVPLKTEPAPPAPLPKQNASSPAANNQEPAQAGARRGDGTQPTALGLQQVQAQYMAFVRAKIREVNERNMPRDWIKDILSTKVSADFRLTLRRGGYIQSLDLLRSSGYRVLDGNAREAIYIAGPFQGWPHDAGDTITLSVTVYYTPLW